MARIAMLTTGPLLENLDAEKFAEFEKLSGQIFEQFGRAKGAISHTGGISEEASSDLWGKWSVPEIYQEDAKTSYIIQTISIWQDLESMVAFSYHGIHAQGLKRKHEWVQKLSRPNHVIWWINDNHQPTWTEGTTHYDRIVKHGTSAQAFNIKDLYDSQGEPVKLNQTLLKEKTQQYSKTE